MRDQIQPLPRYLGLILCELGDEASSFGENSGLVDPATATLLGTLAPRPRPLLWGSLGDIVGRVPLLDSSPGTNAASPTNLEADLVTIADLTK